MHFLSMIFEQKTPEHLLHNGHKVRLTQQGIFLNTS